MTPIALDGSPRYPLPSPPPPPTHPPCFCWPLRPLLPAPPAPAITTAAKTYWHSLGGGGGGAASLAIVQVDLGIGKLEGGGGAQESDLLTPTCSFPGRHRQGKSVDNGLLTPSLPLRWVSGRTMEGSAGFQCGNTTDTVSGDLGVETSI